MSSKNQMWIDLPLFVEVVAQRNRRAQMKKFAQTVGELRARQRQNRLDAHEENRLHNLEKHLSNHGMLDLVPA